ncbi:sensor histidine kinase/response regulator hybrid protein (plasmid) [Rhizobium etli 8C-3]|uniref:histidine kinase n=3 Tax=Rhizobium TaxID=379 RepID=A0A4V2VES8_9HYPH|nr:PAS domain-containing sensor histidine kinase [Rhizobium azibense]APO79176.1 sensor histidine kinase/response regulator hybrid protein [Rhizobium etli 8C-3]TCU29143.1 PAS domain S-box-containing protein [Rhizobium azibense]TCU37785.1 PAS domain S-box-containing protein [Rhizobium azibense]
MFPTGGLMEVMDRSGASLTGEGRLRLLVDAITDYAIYMLSPEGHVATWNVGAQRLKGYSQEEIIGRHFSNFYTEEDRAAGEPERALEIARRDGRFEKEAWRMRKDGSRFWANVVLDAITDDCGKVVGFAKITRDMTEKREIQRALDQAREELFQAQKMEAIGQLTGGIAHDFNNLLMAVLGSLEILKKRMPEQPELMPLVENAMQGAQRGAALTQRMLSFSRRQELAVKTIEIAALMDGMADMLQRSLGPLTMLEIDVLPGVPTIATDPNQLETAILNLIVNARDAMPRGGKITVRAQERTVGEGNGILAPGAYLCLSVIDGGEGMDEETLEQATTPFFTTKGVGKGTGLGLPMVQGLAAQSGGRLVLKSRLGEGTVAELWFPAVLALDDAPQELPDEGADHLGPPRSLRILAVDDDSLVLMNTVLMLEDLGYDAIEAASGADALAILSREPVDLVISDHAMPRMTGAELAEAIRRDWPHMPIILATGYADIPPGSGLIELPRLGKPFSQAQLADAITRTIATATASESRFGSRMPAGQPSSAPSQTM